MNAEDSSSSPGSEGGESNRGHLLQNGMRKGNNTITETESGKEHFILSLFTVFRVYRRIAEFRISWNQIRRSFPFTPSPLNS